MRTVVLLSGRTGTRKSGLSKRLKKEFGFHRVHAATVLSRIAKIRRYKTDRLSLQKLGAELDKETKYKWLVDAVIRSGKRTPQHQNIVVDNVRNWSQLKPFREVTGCRDTNAEVLLGPGITIRVEDLLKEIKECGLQVGQLFIDPQAMIIEPEDIETETGLIESIASTGRGGGAAAARRILSRKPGAVKLAKHVAELKPYLRSTLDRLERAYYMGHFVLLEGTQGSGLSIFHGAYPYVTSRDTNVAGCLAEAGISPSRVRRVLMVVRPTPIRVGNPEKGKGHSGPMKYVTSFDEVADQAGIDPKEVWKAEKTSTTNRDRRVGWFDWALFRKSCALNAPTDIVLTFADYLGVENRRARRFEQLKEDTIKFVEELERVAHAPVSLINTRFPRKEGDRLDLRTVIDRRNWVANKRSG